MSFQRHLPGMRSNNNPTGIQTHTITKKSEAHTHQTYINVLLVVVVDVAHHVEVMREMVMAGGLGMMGMTDARRVAGTETVVLSVVVANLLGSAGGGAVVQVLVMIIRLGMMKGPSPGTHTAAQGSRTDGRRDSGRDPGSGRLSSNDHALNLEIHRSRTETKKKKWEFLSSFSLCVGVCCWP